MAATGLTQYLAALHQLVAAVGVAQDPVSRALMAVPVAVAVVAMLQEEVLGLVDKVTTVAVVAEEVKAVAAAVVALAQPEQTHQVPMVVTAVTVFPLQ